jgi:ribosomal protein L12E/L44/L45/RPP1/RPP2
MTPEWKTGLNSWFMTWNRMALQDLGNTTLFVPCAAPQQVRDQSKEDHLYSSQGIERIQELMRKANAVGSPIAKPNFTGKHRILSTKDGKYPIRIMKNNQNEMSWLMAFTSREDAVRFVEQTKSTDVVIGLSLDELVAQVGENSGVLVDPSGISMTLEPRVLEEALKVRSEKRVIFRPQPAQQPAAQDEAKADQAEAPATPTAQEAPQETTHEVEPSQEVDPSDEEKPGFFSRIFGGK